MNYALLRQFSDDISLLHQRAIVLGYTRTYRLSIDREMIEFGSQGKTLKEREQFDLFLHALKAGDRVIVDEAKTLGQTLEEVIMVINCMLSREVTLSFASVELQIDDATPLARILPLMTPLMADERRIKEERRNQKGRPKGSRSASKFDPYLDRIILMLKDGATVSAIARDLDISRSSLKDYIESRQLKQILDDTWITGIPIPHHTHYPEVPELICTLNSH